MKTEIQRIENYIDNIKYVLSNYEQKFTEKFLVNMTIELSRIEANFMDRL